MYYDTEPYRPLTCIGTILGRSSCQQLVRKAFRKRVRSCCQGTTSTTSSGGLG